MLPPRPFNVLQHRRVGHVGIALCGADIAVPKQLLNGGQWHAAMDEDGGTGHSRTVEGEVLPDVQLPCNALHEHVGATVHRQTGEQPSTGVNELQGLAAEHLADGDTHLHLRLLHPEHEPLLAACSLHVLPVHGPDVGVPQAGVAREEEGPCHQLLFLGS